MNWECYFNFISGLCSILGLFFSVWIFFRTGHIQKKIKHDLLVSNFNKSRDSIMEDLCSNGLNAIRSDFPDAALLFDFQRKLIEYSKHDEYFFSEVELKDINDLVALITKSDGDVSKIDKTTYNYLLNKVTTKPYMKEASK